MVENCGCTSSRTVAVEIVFLKVNFEKMATCVVFVVVIVVIIFVVVVAVPALLSPVEPQM